ncbi:hypothetical protein HRW23_24905 [Streptomyces lunaelactis]|uniref:hypothetical protein n=1 Tax=Streptomyces lunaelactis TaxID=1535768 RepID=UPI001584CD13|nr:hypothetical protein [Streptomyces lunaelactis]NUK33313.1 hypothetical protein [Streptomyces lunaelactis]NUK39805.1 hypothetical protein [Streptomyces lunaelactis]NUK49688.1 hypothetical protein [Streptomyces lunaelactis]NUK63527.1 hypothetical protein [Streptomyces lunaelactis]NUK70976.1 hypothetical protein [Streptomyces lunaelactis]
MIESWAFSDSVAASSPEAVLVRLRARVAGGQSETWLTSSAGRLPAIVANRERAMVMLLDGADDPGEHAMDPGAGGRSNGFVLANGQHDEYSNEETVPLGDT